MKRYIEVVSQETGEVVDKIDVTGRSDSEIDRISEGVYQKFDFDNFFTRDTKYSGMASQSATMTSTAPEPEVGMGATIFRHSSLIPATIIEMSPSGHKIKVRTDKVTLLGGSNSEGLDASKAFAGESVVQRYKITWDLNGRIYEATRRKDGSYRLKGRKDLVQIGERRSHNDHPSL